MRPLAAFGGLAMVVLAACEVEEQLTPVDTSLMVVWSNPLDLAYREPLRYAVVWTLVPTGENSDPIAGARAVWMADGPVPGPVFEAPLVVPSQNVMRDASPRETLELERQWTTPCFRPRITLYEDTDDNGRFSPPAFQSPGTDRVLAIDSGSTCALLDLEGALDGASLEVTETYYVATGYLFTPFAPVSAAGGLGLRFDSAPLVLQLTDSPAPETSLACLRQASISHPAIYATSRVTAHVDVNLEADALCSAVFPECVVEDLTAIEPPVIEPLRSDEVVEAFGCRQAERVEVFIAQEARQVCEGCRCYTLPHSEVYFADPASPPDWWPCGVRVAYCESDLPLYALDTLCDLRLLE